MPTPKEDTEKAKEIAQLIRVHEANCAIKYPNDADNAFRLAIQKKLAAVYQLSELKDKVLTNPEARPARR